MADNTETVGAVKNAPLHELRQHAVGAMQRFCGNDFGLLQQSQMQKFSPQTEGKIFVFFERFQHLHRNLICSVLLRFDDVLLAE